MKTQHRRERGCDESHWLGWREGRGCSWVMKPGMRINAAAQILQCLLMCCMFQVFRAMKRRFFCGKKKGKWDFFDKSGSMTYCETMQRQGNTQEVILLGKWWVGVDPLINLLKQDGRGKRKEVRKKVECMGKERELGACAPAWQMMGGGGVSHIFWGMGGKEGY